MKQPAELGCNNFPTGFTWPDVFQDNVRHCFLEELEDRTLDLRFWIRGVQDPGRDTVIVAIDEKSLEEKGRWPWSRSLQARLVERIKEEGARLIGLDLFYSEPDPREADDRLASAI